MQKKNWLLVLLSFGICGCARSQSTGQDVTFFVPPTLVATPIKTPTMSPISTIPAAIERDCENYLAYVKDVTVPDGYYFHPGDAIEKTWRIGNSGTCRWSKRYSMRLVEGYAYGVEEKLELPDIAPENEGNFTIEFNAPETQGYYFSGWQAYDDLGNPFGEEIFMSFYVDPDADAINEYNEKYGYYDEL